MSLAVAILQIIETHEDGSILLKIDAWNVS